MCVFYNPTTLIQDPEVLFRLRRAARVGSKALKRSKVLEQDQGANRQRLCGLALTLFSEKSFTWLLFLLSVLLGVGGLGWMGVLGALLSRSLILDECLLWTVYIGHRFCLQWTMILQTGPLTSPLEPSISQPQAPKSRPGMSGLVATWAVGPCSGGRPLASGPWAGPVAPGTVAVADLGAWSWP